jgi:hypothetical protein
VQVREGACPRVVLSCLCVLFAHQCGGGGVRREGGGKPSGTAPRLRVDEEWVRVGTKGGGLVPASSCASGSCLHVKREVEGGNREGVPFLLFLALLWRWGPKAEGVNRRERGRVSGEGAPKEWGRAPKWEGGDKRSCTRYLPLFVLYLLQTNSILFYFFKKVKSETEIAAKV